MKLKKMIYKDRKFAVAPEGQTEFQFTFDTFPYTIHILFTPDISKSLYYLADRDNFNAYSAGDCTACHVYAEGRGVSYLLFSPLATPGTYAHESWHAVNQLMKWTGITPENEFIAYHLGYTVNQIIAFKEQISKSRKVQTTATAKRKK